MPSPNDLPLPQSQPLSIPGAPAGNDRLFFVVATREDLRNLNDAGRISDEQMNRILDGAPAGPSGRYFVVFAGSDAASATPVHAFAGSRTETLPAGIPGAAPGSGIAFLEFHTSINLAANGQNPVALNDGILLRGIPLVMHGETERVIHEEVAQFMTAARGAGQFSESSVLNQLIPAAAPGTSPGGSGNPNVNLPRPHQSPFFYR
jgi:hypothetical protein